jgi:hypothetical protein
MQSAKGVVVDMAANANLSLILISTEVRSHGAIHDKEKRGSISILNCVSECFCLFLFFAKK